MDRLFGSNFRYKIPFILANKHNYHMAVGKPFLNQIKTKSYHMN